MFIVYIKFIIFSDVSDTILYLLLGTTEPAEIENAEVNITVKEHKNISVIILFLVSFLFSFPGCLYSVLKCCKKRYA